MKFVPLFALLTLVPLPDEEQRVVAAELAIVEAGPSIRAIWAARHLGRSGAAGAIPALRRLWCSEDASSRHVALDALASLGDPLATGLILRELRSDDLLRIYGAVVRLESVRRADLAVHLVPFFGDERNPFEGNPCEIGLPLGMEAERVYAALTTRFPSSDPPPASRPSSPP